MRLFVGIAPDAATRDVFARYMAGYLADRVRSPVLPANLHATVRFIGEVPATLLPEIRDALAEIRAGAPTMTVEAIAAFPQRKPHTVVGLLARDPHLAGLVGAVGAALDPMVPAGDARPYIGHVTLARVERRHLARLGELRNLEASWKPRTFELFESRRVGDALSYESLLSVPFVG